MWRRPFPAGAAGFELPEGTQLSAQSVYIVNLDTGLCVYEQNADEKRSVASLTKLMTALLLIENVEDLEGTYISGGTALYTEEITDPQASNADILPNEEVRVIDLLYAMMLPSANEGSQKCGLLSWKRRFEQFLCPDERPRGRTGLHKHQFHQRQRPCRYG